MSKFTKIIVNGREYENVGQMPEDVRRQYEEMMATLGRDENGDGIPDVLQQPGASSVIFKKSITYNGRECGSEDELPQGVKEMLAQVPYPKPGETEGRVEVERTSVSEPRISLSAGWSRRPQEQLSTGLSLKLSWFFVLLLLGAVFVLLFLWLSGTKPADLLR